MVGMLLTGGLCVITAHFGALSRAVRVSGGSPEARLYKAKRLYPARQNLLRAPSVPDTLP